MFGRRRGFGVWCGYKKKVAFLKGITILLDGGESRLLKG